MNYELLEEWQNAKDELCKWQTIERDLRIQLFNETFPVSHEGTNEVPIGNNYKLIAKCPINRKIDEIVLPDTLTILQKQGINTDNLVKTEHKLSLAAYRKLPESAQRIFDACLTSTPGSIQLEIKEP